MPVLDWECSLGHIFQKFIRAVEVTRGMTIKCEAEGCPDWAIRVHLTPRQSEMAKGYEPTLYYEDPNGEICMPAFNDPSQLPPAILQKLKAEGYKEKYLNTYREYEAFRSQYSQRKREENQLVDEIRKLDHAALKSDVHNTINSGFSYIDKEGNQCRVPPLSEMHPRLRAVAEMCLAYVDKDVERERDADYYIDARENDGSYEYRDRQEQNRWI